MRRSLLVAGLLLCLGCGAVKRRVTVEVPTAHRQARTATLEELLELINQRYASVRGLAVSELKIDFQSGSADAGYLEEYRSARGYSIVQSPSSIFVNVLNPLTRSTLVAMATDGETFQVWIPRENKYLTGRNDVELQEENPLYNVRPQHILNALLVEPLPVDEPGYAAFVKEAQDARFKYYVLGLLDLEAGPGRAELVRELWIERSRLRLVRENRFEGGVLVSQVTYNQSVEIEGHLLSADVRVDRKAENYSIRLEFDKERIRVNPAVREGTFDVPRPAGAELVVVQAEPALQQVP